MFGSCIGKYAALKPDLEAALEIWKKTPSSSILGRKDVIERLSNELLEGKLEDVVRELFNREELLKVLASSGLVVGMPVEKAAINDAMYDLTSAMFDKIFGVEEVEVAKLLSKHVHTESGAVDFRAAQITGEFADKNCEYSFTIVEDPRYTIGTISIEKPEIALSAIVFTHHVEDFFTKHCLVQDGVFVVDY